MPRILNGSQLIHQPLYDTWVKNIGSTSVPNNKQLFGAANVGLKDMTNLQVPGQLASDQTYLLKSVRFGLYFQSLADPVFTDPVGSLTAVTNVSASNAMALDLMSLFGYGAFFTLNIGQKPYLTAPVVYAPAGMGPAGFTTENSRNVSTNGIASHTSILKLAKAIPISPRQAFGIQVEVFPFQRNPQGLGAGGGAIGTDISTLDYVNTFDGIKYVVSLIDGVITRDIE